MKKIERKFRTTVCFCTLLLCLLFSVTVKAEYLWKSSDQAKAETMQWLKSNVGKHVGNKYVSLVVEYYMFLSGLDAYDYWNGEYDNYDDVMDYLTNDLPDGWTRVEGGIPQAGDILLYCLESESEYFEADNIAIYGGGNVCYVQNTGTLREVNSAYDDTRWMYYDAEYWGLIRPDFSKARHIVAAEDTGDLTILGYGVDERYFQIGRIVGENRNVFDVSFIPGLSYDPATNTLTLTNADLTGKTIEYKYGGKILNIKLNGVNKIDGIYLGSNGTPYNAPGITITGNGTLNVIGADSYAVWQGHGIDGETIDGDINIDGVTIVSDGGGIVSNAGNLTIKNAKIVIENGGEFMGIITGRESYHKAGTLTIQNSEIELKNFNSKGAAIAYNQCTMPGMNTYSGDGKAEYQIKLESLCEKDRYSGRFSSYANYVLLTNKDLNLPKVYHVEDITEYNAQGKISISDEFAKSGQEINVTVNPDAGYVLHQLFVNGNAISGTKFIMPDQDTTVKATFKKKEIKVSSIKLSGITKQVAKGKKITLTANVSPADATNKTLTWSTSNKKYATVNSRGVVTTKTAGAGKTVTITAKAADGSGKKATYKIRIMKGMVKKVTIKGKTSVKAGKTLKLKASVKTTSGANKTLTWSTSNKKYATVNKNGVVKALKAGKGKTVKITAKATDGSGKKATIKIKIK